MQYDTVHCNTRRYTKTEHNLIQFDVAQRNAPQCNEKQHSAMK